MAERWLYPRLPRPIALEVAVERRKLPIDKLRAESSLDRPGVWYAASNLPRVTDGGSLRELVERIRGVADTTLRSSPTRTRDFDVQVARILWEEAGLTANEAGQDDVWSFLCAVAMPDVVRARFPGRDGVGTDVERFLGGARNTLGRLWWRAYALLDPDATDPLHLVGRLPEDALVQIGERPTIAGYPPLARAFAYAVLDTPSAGLRGGQEDLVRDAIKRSRRRAAIVAFETLSPSQLDRDIREVVAASAKALTESQPTAAAAPAPAAPAPEPSAGPRERDGRVLVFEWTYGEKMVDDRWTQEGPVVQVLDGPLRRMAAGSTFTVRDGLARRSWVWRIADRLEDSDRYVIPDIETYCRERHAEYGDTVQVTFGNTLHEVHLRRRE